jgi:HK97 family phage portal protein
MRNPIAMFSKWYLDRNSDMEVGRAMREGPPADAEEIPDVVVQSLANWGALLGGNRGGVPKELDNQAAHAAYHRWPYAASTAVAKAGMLVPWVVEVKQGDEWVEDEDNPLARLLRNPNAFMTSAEMFFLMLIDLGTVGQSYWHFDRDFLGKGELLPMTGVITAKCDDDGRLIGWHQKTKSKNLGIVEKDFDIDDVVYLRIPRPGDPIGGFGATQAAGSAIVLDTQTLESEYSAMRQGVHPSIILRLADKDPKKRSQTVEEFEQKHAGTRKNGGVIGISKNMEVIDTKTNPREMAFADSANMRRDEILAMAQVPASILGLSKNFNKSNIDGSNKIFDKFAVWPILVMADARLNQDLGKHYNPDPENPTVRVRHINPIPEDKAHLLEQQKVDIETNVKTINDVRGERGLEPVEWGDEPWINRSLAQPSDESRSGGGGEQSVITRIPADSARVILGRPGTTYEITQQEEIDPAPDPIGVVTADKISRRAHDMQVPLVKKLDQSFVRYFDELGRDLLRAMDEAAHLLEPVRASMAHLVEQFNMPYGINRVLDPNRLAQKMADRTKPINRFGITLGGDFEQGFHGNETTHPWNEGFLAVQEKMAEFGPEHYKEMAYAQRRTYEQIITDGLKENLTFRELRDLVVIRLQRMKESDAARIATTEATKLFGAGGQAFRETYDVKWKQWIATFVNTRNTHAAVPSPIRNDEFFQVGGDVMQWPGGGGSPEENINCNCVAVGLIKKSD